MEINVKKGGFSMVEIMVSLLLISIALFAIVAVFPKMAHHNKTIREIDEAYSIAATVLDSLQRKSQAVLNHGHNVTLPVVVRENISFTPSLSVSVTDGYLKTALVTVRWTKAGKSHQTQLAGVVR